MFPFGHRNLEMLMNVLKLVKQYVDEYSIHGIVHGNGGNLDEENEKFIIKIGLLGVDDKPIRL